MRVLNYQVRQSVESSAYEDCDQALFDEVLELVAGDAECDKSSGADRSWPECGKNSDCGVVSTDNDEVKCN